MSVRRTPDGPERFPGWECTECGAWKALDYVSDPWWDWHDLTCSMVPDEPEDGRWPVVTYMGQPISGYAKSVDLNLPYWPNTLEHYKGAIAKAIERKLGDEISDPGPERPADAVNPYAWSYAWEEAWL